MPPCLAPRPAPRPGPGSGSHMGSTASRPRPRSTRTGRARSGDYDDDDDGDSPGLTGRRSQSSGSLCLANRTERLGRFLAPCGRHAGHSRRRHRDHGEGGGSVGSSVRDIRYKLCGSLPNHLDTTPPYDGDNNNITPASPASPSSPGSPSSPLGPHRKARALSVRSLGALDGHDVMGLDPSQDLGYASERSPDDEKLFPGALSGFGPGTVPCRTVVLERGPRGLGLSVCGGIDYMADYGDGLVRVKRLFPHQPAWQSGRLQPGDVLLAVNGKPLGGLTNHEALEVLRTAPDRVVLNVARPAHQHQELPAQPVQLQRREPQQISQPPDPRLLLRQDSCGELEVALTKVQGSLGFTLRKEDSSALGHYVRALVREPALSDGRVRPGDKIVAVNGVDISLMSHEEAVMFLRNAGDTVCLRLYRDVAQTPVSALSPTETHKAFRPKPLRKEALDMLSDLAVRKMMPAGDSSTLGRLRRVSDGRTSQRARTQSFSPPQTKDQPSQPCQPSQASQPLVELADTTRSNTSTSLSSVSSSTSCTGSVVERVPRPNFLDLNGGSRPQWQLKKLTTSSGEDAGSSPPEVRGADHTWLNHIEKVDSGKSSNFASLPCEAMSPPGHCRSNFSYRNPAYQSASSAHPASRTARNASTAMQEQDSLDGSSDPDEGCKGLLKWKGVVFTPEDDTDTSDNISQTTLHDPSGQVLTVELNRGWNARLGFSLQPDVQDSGHSVISAIYSDSVAAKDGRLRIGDRVIMVNDESVEGMGTTEVIDLFRKIRGPIAITVWRQMES